MPDWYVSSAAWTAIAQFATGSYSVGQIVRPLTAPAFTAQFAFRCTTAGSATAEPTWSSAASNNSTVTATGGAVFTNVSGQAAYGWSAAAGNLYCMGNAGGSYRSAPGDRFFLSSDHSESSGGGTYQFYGSSTSGVIQFISVNRGGSVPPAPGDATPGATIISTSNITIETQPPLYWQGVTLSVANTLNINSGGVKTDYLRNCAIVMSGTSGHVGFGNPAGIVLDNTTVSFANASEYLSIGGGNYPCLLYWINTPSAVLGAAVPANLFQYGGGNAIATCRGVDLSAATGALVNGNNGVRVLLDSCRIAPGLTRYPTPSNNWNTLDEVELVNCFDGTNIVSERHTNLGDITLNRSTTMVGGAQDDVGLFSLRMITNAYSDFLVATLDSFWMDVENTAVGASHTATVELISSGTLNNTDIALVLEYQGTAGSSLTALVSTLPSALAVSAALPTSTATWNSPPATPVAQHLQATFTPQTAGRVRGIVRLGKPSTTVFINPQITIT